MMKTAHIITATVFLLSQAFSIKADGVKINLGNKTFTSSTELIFTTTSTVGFEKGLDREYRKPPANDLNYIYSIAEATHKLYVNYLQKPSAHTAIELQVVVRKAGTFSFYIEERTNTQLGLEFSLTDVATGKTIEIVPGAITEFTFDNSDVRKKKDFILHIYPPLKVIASQVSCNESKNGTIDVLFNPGGDWEAKLRTPSSVILQTEKTSTDKISFNNLVAGVYYIEIWKGDVMIREEITAISRSAGLQSKFTLSNDTVITGKRFSTNNLSSGGNSWFWEFGDGKSTAGYDVSHFYVVPGKYAVTLTTSNTAGCISTSSKTILVESLKEKPYTVIAQ